MLMLVKKGGNYASPFYFKFGENISITMQQKSKRQTYLPYETLTVHNSLSDNYKNSNK